MHYYDLNKYKKIPRKVLTLPKPNKIKNEYYEFYTTPQTAISLDNVKLKLSVKPCQDKKITLSNFIFINVMHIEKKHW